MEQQSQADTTAAPYWTLHAAAQTACARIEVGEYDFPRPVELWEVDNEHSFSLMLPRPGGAQGTVQYEAASAQRVGAMLFRPAGVRMHSVGEGGRLSVARCIFHEAAFSSLTALADWDAQRFKKCAALKSQPLADAARRLLREVVSPGFGASLAIESNVHLVMIEIARVFRGREVETRCKGGLAPWQLAKIEERLRAADGAWPTMEELAAECRVSRSHMSRAFVKTTGTTLAEHAATLRLERAKEIMAETDLSMSQIAAKLGFANPSTFTAAFSRATGQSPLKYARLVRSR